MSSKILDIGSGQNPHKDATHFLEKYPDKNVERGADFVKPKGNLHIGDVEDMYFFKDNEYDYSYCKHVLEHVLDPVKACSEIMRVSKAGYIETPTEMWERMFGRTYHKWVVKKEGNTLIFKANKYQSAVEAIGWSFDTIYAQDIHFRSWFDTNIDKMYVRFEWKNDFNVKVI